MAPLPGPFVLSVPCVIDRAKPGTFPPRMCIGASSGTGGTGEEARLG